MQKVTSEFMYNKYLWAEFHANYTDVLRFSKCPAGFFRRTVNMSLGPSELPVVSFKYMYIDADIGQTG